jgi:hypothetical protein
LVCKTPRRSVRQRNASLARNACPVVPKASAADGDGNAVIIHPPTSRDHAAAIAGELALDDTWDGYVVSVIDERGNEITRVPIDPQPALRTAISSLA